MTLELTFRPITRTDLDLWFSLVTRIQDHDDEHERLSRSDLAAMTRRPWVDLARDSMLVLDGDGVPRAWGRTSFRPGRSRRIAVHLMGGVDPRWRGRGLGRRILSWQTERALHNVADLRAARAAPDLPAEIGGFVEEQILGRRELFEAAGFEASRWFTDLRLDLKAAAGPASTATLPAQLRVVPFDHAVSDRVRVAHNIAFAEHWGFTPYTPEAWTSYILNDEAFRPELSFAIVDTSSPDEPVVAFVQNAEYERDWDLPDDREGDIDYLGVVPQWRAHGLASHLLSLSAARFVARGHRFAALGVDAGNATRALDLYLSLGYVPVHRTTYFSKNV